MLSKEENNPQHIAEEDDCDWISSLDEGDQVFVCTNEKTTLKKVTRTTSTLIIVGDSKYRKGDGKIQKMSRWRPDYLKEASKEALISFRDKLKRQAILKKARTLDLSKLSTEQLETLCGFIND